MSAFAIVSAPLRRAPRLLLECLDPEVIALLHKVAQKIVPSAAPVVFQAATGEPLDSRHLRVGRPLRPNPGETALEYGHRCFVPAVASLVIVMRDHAAMAPSDPMPSSGTFQVVFRDPAATTKTYASIGAVHPARWALANGAEWVARTTYAAARGGHVEFLEWAVRLGCLLDEEASYAAARGGSRKALEWILANGGVWHPSTTEGAAKFDRRNLIQWVIAHAADIAGFEWAPYTVAAAARRGFTEFVRTVLGAGCPCYAEDTAAAARRGHAACAIAIARITGTWHSRTISVAVWGGHHEIIEELRRAGCPWADDTVRAMSRFGLLEEAQAAVAAGCPFPGAAGQYNGGSVGLDDSSMSLARLRALLPDGARELSAVYEILRTTARRGDRSFAQWVIDRFAPPGSPHHPFVTWPCDVTLLAAREGHREFIRWAVAERGCEWSADTMVAAAETGDSGLALWLREQGCPWGPATICVAGSRGQLPFAKVARANGCPWGREPVAGARIRHRYTLNHQTGVSDFETWVFSAGYVEPPPHPPMFPNPFAGW